MRIVKLAIDGYGRFAQYSMDLAPGLQVIFGPNERGKSTLRSFIGDMLYGQKRSALQRLFDDANELRCPWMNPDVYGGRIVYQLDDGREIEVYRRFDRKNEMVHVYDKTNARDITNAFEQLKNREPQFALKHVGLSKEVFLSTATISHFTLDDLGDAEAMAQIRERILALADTGDERTCADATLRRLKTRVETIGQPGARTRPLPSARSRLAELDRELEAATALRDELADAQQRRQAVHEEIEALRARRAAIEANMDAVERLARAEQLREAELITAQIDTITQRCFALGAARDFPLDMTPEVLHTNTRLLAARDQLERTRREKADLEEQVALESDRIGQAAATSLRDIPEEYDQRLGDTDAAIHRLRERIDGVVAAREASEARLCAAEAEFAAVPDFSRLADDPVTWINQLASSFRVAVRCRDDDSQKRTHLREQAASRKTGMTELEALFAGCPDFANLARDYEVNGRMHEEQAGQMRAVVEQLFDTVEEHGDMIAAFGKFTLLACAFLIVLLGVAFTTGNRGVYVPTGIVAVAAVAFGSMTLHGRTKTNRAQKLLEEKQAELQQLWDADNAQRKRIDQMIVDGGCQTIRELDGKYDQYRKACVELASLEESLEIQERKAAEAEQRVGQLFEHLRDVFQSMGEALNSEADVDTAAGRAAGRYQVYRDAKRRIAENKDQIKKHDADEAKAKEELAVLLEQERGLALEVRRLMRENGYPEESRHDSALMALRSYRIRRAETLKKRGRIDVLQEKLADVQRHFAEDQGNLTRLEETLTRYLATGKCESVAQWMERSKQGKEYAEVRDRMTALQEQLRTVLRNTDINALRAAVSAAPPPQDRAEARAEESKLALERVSADIDARMKEEHAIHLALTERAAGTRSISEIEEERALLRERLEALEFELEAATYAMALIEEIARDKHARIAPRLATRAGDFLREITGGAYDEVLINRDLAISVRIPQTSLMSENPEKSLSKGTVDQIYLALRLAMVQSMSESGESIPLLLDDPFANYDDFRLERALDLLARLSENNQVILFTCREDVVRAAQNVEAPICRIEGPMASVGEETPKTTEEQA